MPTAIVGFTRDEAINQIIDIIGNNSATFLTYLQTNITSWEYEFYYLHDWSFAHVNGVADSVDLAVVANTSSYTLNTATIGYEMDSLNVEAIYSQTSGNERKLIPTTLRDIRISDPKQASTGKAMFYAPYGRQGITLWPTPNANETLYIDGKIHGTELNSNITIPIPYKFQELFIQFCLTKALRRERDPRATSELQVFSNQLKYAIAEDLRYLESNLRMKTTNEEIFPPTQHDLNTRLWFTEY